MRRKLSAALWGLVWLLGILGCFAVAPRAQAQVLNTAYSDNFPVQDGREVPLPPGRWIYQRRLIGKAGSTDEDSTYYVLRNAQPSAPNPLLMVTESAKKNNWGSARCDRLERDSVANLYSRHGSSTSSLTSKCSGLVLYTNIRMLNAQLSGGMALQSILDSLGHMGTALMGLHVFVVDRVRDRRLQVYAVNLYPQDGGLYEKLSDRSKNYRSPVVYWQIKYMEQLEAALLQKAPIERLDDGVYARLLAVFADTLNAPATSAQVVAPAMTATMVPSVVADARDAQVLQRRLPLSDGMELPLPPGQWTLEQRFALNSNAIANANDNANAGQGYVLRNRDAGAASPLLLIAESAPADAWSQGFCNQMLALTSDQYFNPYSASDTTLVEKCSGYVRLNGSAALRSAVGETGLADAAVAWLGTQGAAATRDMGLSQFMASREQGKQLVVYLLHRLPTLTRGATLSGPLRAAIESWHPSFMAQLEAALLGNKGALQDTATPFQRLETALAATTEPTVSNVPTTPTAPIAGNSAVQRPPGALQGAAGIAATAAITALAPANPAAAAVVAGAGTLAATTTAATTAIAGAATNRELEQLSQLARQRELELQAQQQRTQALERQMQESLQREQQRKAQEQASAAELERLRTELARAQERAKPAAPLAQANRRAFVVGNDTYQQVGKLRNSRADARAMADNLARVGYQVSARYDLSERELRAAWRTFKNQVQPGDEVAVFYAGHGVQLGNANYLLPVDITSESEDQIKDESLMLQRILDDLAERKARFALAMIDACRDNPFAGTGRSLGGMSRGLAPTMAATGQMIVFSAGSGQQALDRLGPNDRDTNGLFTRVFIREMMKPGLSVDRIVRNVRNEVVKLARSVGHEQVPAIYDQAVGEFFFLH